MWKSQGHWTSVFDNLLCSNRRLRYLPSSSRLCLDYCSLKTHKMKKKKLLTFGSYLHYMFRLDKLWWQVWAVTNKYTLWLPDSLQPIISHYFVLCYSILPFNIATQPNTALVCSW